jgi:ligand-binding SRPBCC domain-containing protein
MSRRIELSIFIAAPIERCFDLARDVEAHMSSTPGTSERVVAGRTTGLFELHDEVTWEAVHFRVKQRLTSRITKFDRPHHFRDSMVRGAFERFDHDHFFTEANGGTHCRDVFDYDAPLGPLGAIAERLFLTRYMRNFLETRLRLLKAMAEAPSDL